MNPQALVIDDEPDILELLTMTFESMSVDCVTAENIAQAEQALSQQNFDFCLTDMRLPDGNGLDFVKALQANKPDLPVAVISAHGNMDLAVQALKLGAFDFISKPVKLRVLRDLVDHILEQLAAKNGLEEPPEINNDAMTALQIYSFPGNVRELENILERALTWMEGEGITETDLMLPEQRHRPEVSLTKRGDPIQKQVAPTLSSDLGAHLEDQERQLITEALESARWNKTAAAKKLGISFRALRYKLKKLDLE